ncbi:acyl-CoA dehydrogenase family protein [cf. Phormidesmis sp. LEGE 11477]|uniref:acyl-CoA dehydrogenase family protein n=1 Tax=cf. Phormidesmis sp. LEGE 11477 TaxID=1828680 RepID=UPI00187E254E|nr:acyl-CoA dehydrogenase family protein [cf. Phormidesmis sp. LEGE 11477]MBE9060882.1 acyl-CoA/acyl-ACP dehydrogenase [cf. Phormidesmis sp. LEGE 11477]
MTATSTYSRQKSTSDRPLSSSPSLSSQSSSSAAELLQMSAEIAEKAALNAASVDCIGGFPAEDFSALAEAGLLSAPLRSDLGGAGLGFDASQMGLLLQILKQIGRGNLSLGRVFEGHVNALQLVQTFATEEQIQTFAKDVHHQKVFGVWNAEAADGVKLHPLGARRYRLEGSKTFCSGCGYVERPFVSGMLPDGGWQMCIVPMEKVEVAVDPDWWQPPGMRASASYKVDFTGVEIGPNEVISEPGDYFRQPWLSGGVVRFAAVQLGGAEALFDATREYLQDLGRTDHPHQQARLGKMAIALEQGNLWLQGSAAQIERYAAIFGGMPSQPHPNSAQLVGYCNMVRTAIEQICMDMIQLSERCIGTQGLLPPHPMERIIRDLTLYLRQPAFDASLTGIGEYVLSSEVRAMELWS